MVHAKNAKNLHRFRSARCALGMLILIVLAFPAIIIQIEISAGYVNHTSLMASSVCLVQMPFQ